MSLDIHGVTAGGIPPDFGKSDGIHLHGIQQRTSPPVNIVQPASTKPAPDEVLREMLDIPESFQRKLKFSIIKELDMVVVKVIDAETDKIIKEIPPQEIQNLHERIREALGLLIDEKV